MYGQNMKFIELQQLGNVNSGYLFRNMLFPFEKCNTAAQKLREKEDILKG
jgi:hypothetical protein